MLASTDKMILISSAWVTLIGRGSFFTRYTGRVVVGVPLRCVVCDQGCGVGERAYVRAESNIQKAYQNLQMHLPPERERIAMAVSCVLHPHYLKTYLGCDRACR